MSLSNLNTQELKEYKAYLTAKRLKGVVDGPLNFDTKYASHLVRLAYECEMILTEGTLDLRRHNEHLKRIRKGEVPKEEILKWFGEKELQLNALYASSKLQHKPDEQKIKSLLLSCLETHYGTLDKCYKESTITEQAIREIGQILERYKLI
jgi:hypothetical protein